MGLTATMGILTLGFLFFPAIHGITGGYESSAISHEAQKDMRTLENIGLVLLAPTAILFCISFAKFSL